MPPGVKKAQSPKSVEDVKLPGVSDDADNDSGTDSGTDSGNDPDNGEDKNTSEIENEQATADDEKDTTETVEQGMVKLTQPCRRCFPGGWPAQESGAHVNCPHEFPITWGDVVSVSAERAAELGFDVEE